MKKILTVIVPAYNMEAFLPGCLASLLSGDAAQRRKLDVLVVNDGSRDRTGPVARACAARHPDVVRVIDKPNGHYGSCVNAALPQAAGVFVKVVDADDALDAEGLARLVAALEAWADDGETDLALNDYLEVGPDGHVFARRGYPLPAEEAFALDRCCAANPNLALHAITYRTEVFRRFAYRQAEGVPYSDNEWATLPLGFVRKARYRPFVVYRYLVARDGQTMTPETFSANFHHVSALTLGMIRRWQTLAPSAVPSSAPFVRARLLALVRLVYRTNLFKWRQVKTYPNDDLWAFDRALKRLSRDLYDAAGRYTGVAGRSPLLSPVRAFRFWRTRNSPPFWVRDVLHWLKGRAR